MERILKLKDIAGYLPYELHCLNCDDMIEIIEFDNAGNLMRGIDLQEEAEDDEWAKSQQYKPILRPLSDLYKIITHNGKEIIPIVELAILYSTNRNWIFYCGNAICGDRIFGFEDGGFFYELDNVCENVENQYQLFDYLHELKIDYRGLIDAGLAIDCNTLQENPYK